MNSGLVTYELIWGWSQHRDDAFHQALAVLYPYLFDVYGRRLLFRLTGTGGVTDAHENWNEWATQRTLELLDNHVHAVDTPHHGYLWMPDPKGRSRAGQLLILGMLTEGLLHRNPKQLTHLYRSAESFRSYYRTIYKYRLWEALRAGTTHERDSGGIRLLSLEELEATGGTPGALDERIERLVDTLSQPDPPDEKARIGGDPRKADMFPFETGGAVATLNEPPRAEGDSPGLELPSLTRLELVELARDADAALAAAQRSRTRGSAACQFLLVSRLFLRWFLWYCADDPRRTELGDLNYLSWSAAHGAAAGREPVAVTGATPTGRIELWTSGHERLLDELPVEELCKAFDHLRWLELVKPALIETGQPTLGERWRKAYMELPVMWLASTEAQRVRVRNQIHSAKRHLKSEGALDDLSAFLGILTDYNAEDEPPGPRQHVCRLFRRLLEGDASAGQKHRYRSLALSSLPAFLAYCSVADELIDVGLLPSPALARLREKLSDAHTAYDELRRRLGHLPVDLGQLALLVARRRATLGPASSGGLPVVVGERIESIPLLDPHGSPVSAVSGSARVLDVDWDPEARTARLELETEGLERAALIVLQLTAGGVRFSIAGDHEGRHAVLQLAALPALLQPVQLDAWWAIENEQ